MKKALGFGLILCVLLAALLGCSTNEPQKSEEELKNEIRAELEAEQKASDNAKKTVDIKNMDVLYDFVKKEIANDIAREDFNKWEILYFDITGDGTDEAVLASDDWNLNMAIITGDSEELKQIPSDIPIMKYANTVELKDGFLAVTGKTGGTGEQMEVMNLYVYNGTGMIKVLEDLDVSHRVSAMNDDYEETGVIDGPLQDFVYKLTHHDNKTGKDTILVNKHYTYNKDTMSFRIEPAGSENELVATTSSQTPGAVDIKDLKVGSVFEGGTIKKISYKANGNDATLDFTLGGEFTLTGQVAFNEFDDGLIFTADQSMFPTEIILSGSLGTINPFGWPMWFRNENTFISQVGKVTYDKLLNNSEYKISIVVQVKDLVFSCKIPGQAGGNWELLEIKEIKE